MPRPTTQLRSVYMVSLVTHSLRDPNAQILRSCHVPDCFFIENGTSSANFVIRYENPRTDLLGIMCPTPYEQLLTIENLHEHLWFTGLQDGVRDRVARLGQGEIEQWRTSVAETDLQSGRGVEQQALHGAPSPSLEAASLNVEVPSKLLLRNGDLRENLSSAKATDECVSSPKVQTNGPETTDTSVSLKGSKQPKSKNTGVYVPPHKRAAPSTVTVSVTGSYLRSTNGEPELSPEDSISRHGTKEHGTKEHTPSAKIKPSACVEKVPSKQGRIKKPIQSKAAKLKRPARWVFQKKERALDQPWR